MVSVGSVTEENEYFLSNLSNIPKDTRVRACGHRLNRAGIFFYRALKRKAQKQNYQGRVALLYRVIGPTVCVCVYFFGWWGCLLWSHFLQPE